MKLAQYLVVCFVLLFSITNITNAQNVGFIDSDTLLKKFPEILLAQQLVQIMTDEWIRELDSMQLKIDGLEIEIEKKRLNLTEKELQSKESELAILKKAREDYAGTIFEPNGKYDEAVKTIFQPIEEKISKP